jgi:hypothetical protein
MQITAQLDEASQFSMLQQIQTRLQAQEQQMLQLEQGTCAECVPVLQQTREMLRLRLREVENRPADPGIENPNHNQTQTPNQNQLRIHQTPQAAGTAIPPYGTSTPLMDGTGQQNGGGSPSGATPVQQQNQNQHNKDQDREGTQNGGNSGGNGSSGGSDDGSSNGNGGQGGKP